MEVVRLLSDEDVDRIMGIWLRTQVAERLSQIQSIDRSTLGGRWRSVANTAERVLELVLKRTELSREVSREMLSATHPLGQVNIAEGLPNGPDGDVWNLIVGLEALTLPDMRLEFVLETMVSEGGEHADKAKAALAA